MPELPEVETVRRGLAPVMEGARINRLTLNRPNLRFDFPEDLKSVVEGQLVVALGRRAKYLLLELERGDVVIMHLGMSGSFRTHVSSEAQTTPGEFYHPRGKDGKHDHVVFDLDLPDGRTAQVIYNDPRRFGFMLLTTRAEQNAHALIRDLGVEPMGNTLSADYLANEFAGKKAPLKAALLDQKIIAGLGNIYVCEVLWRTGLSPRRQAQSIVLKSGKPSARAVELVDNIKQVIAEAIASGGSSLRDHAQTDGTLGYFQHSFAVYDRESEPCSKAGCNSTIRRLVQSGRSTFYCPRCQR